MGICSGCMSGSARSTSARAHARYSRTPPSSLPSPRASSAASRKRRARRPGTGLKQLGVRGGHAVPAHCVQVRREQPWLVETPAGDDIPGRLADLRVDFPLPQHLQRLALGVVLQESRISVLSSGCGGGTTSSTRYCRERTWTICPACGCCIFSPPPREGATSSVVP